MTTLNVNALAASRTNWPNWNQRGRIRKVDDGDNVVQGQYAFNAEVVHISPRYQKNGQNFRVRPERPAAFFAAWCFEHGLLPSLLTPEECQSEAGLAILQPLWETYQGHFPKLESPNAACDERTQPSLRIGFSFCVLQMLVEQTGSVKSNNGSSAAMPVNGNGAVGLDAMKAKIEEMRARTTTSTPMSALPLPKAKK